MLKQKSDAIEAFKNFKAQAEKQSGKQLKTLRTDGAAEYDSGDLKKFYATEAINHEVLAPYTPRHNIWFCRKEEWNDFTHGKMYVEDQKYA